MGGSRPYQQGLLNNRGCVLIPMVRKLGNYHGEGKYPHRHLFCWLTCLMLLTSLSPGFRAMSRSGFSCTFDRSLTTQIRSCRMGPEVQGWQLETLWTMPKQREKKKCVYIYREREIDVNVYNSCVYIYAIYYMLASSCFTMFRDIKKVLVKNMFTSYSYILLQTECLTPSSCNHLKWIDLLSLIIKIGWQSRLERLRQSKTWGGHDGNMYMGVSKK